MPHYKTLTFTHISFVADCFLFCRAIEVESSTLTKILDTYGRASRQLVNFHKSKVFFSPHATNDIKQHIMSFLGISNIIGTRKYLRMSSPIGRKKNTFLSSWRINFGIGSIIGQINTCQKNERKFFSNLLPKPYLPTTWVFTYYHWFWRMKFKSWWTLFGGAQERDWVKAFIGSIGKS